MRNRLSKLDQQPVIADRPIEGRERCRRRTHATSRNGRQSTPSWASCTRIVRAKATGFKLSGNKLVAVLTETGEIACDAAVVAAGAHSKRLTASVGDPLPLETERGYHVMIEHPESGPRSSMMASDAKMVVNWTDKGLRAAGTVEIDTGVHQVADWPIGDLADLGD